MKRDGAVKLGGLALTSCSVLAAFWFVVFVISGLPGADKNAAMGIQAFALLFFVILHGSLTNGWRGFLAYAAIALAVDFAMEASSVATGFPFGFYVHNVPGPKLLGVPPQVVLGYVCLSWLAWSVTRAIVRTDPNAPFGPERIATPLVASFVLMGYDYAFDPIGATVFHLYSYRSPSGMFGVPVVNFLGWLLTGWVSFQLFAVLEDRFRARSAVVTRASFNALPCVIWGAFSLQYLLLAVFATSGISRAGSRVFVTSDICEGAIAASLVTLVFTALLGLLRIWSGSPLDIIRRR
jgi:putative membrane protein